MLVEDALTGRVADLTRLDRPILLIIDYVEGGGDQPRALAEGVIAGWTRSPECCINPPVIPTSFGPAHTTTGLLFFPSDDFMLPNAA